VQLASDDAGRHPARAGRDPGDRRNGKDAWGVPILNVEFSWSDNERDMARDMAQTAAEMLEACGGKHIKPFDAPLAPGLAIHEMGTARMGRDPRTSVVNGFGQSHDVRNLYVVDGSVMPTSPCQNPSLTYMAFASRAARHAALQLRKGNLRSPQRTAMLTLSGGAGVLPAGNARQAADERASDEPTPREDEGNA
jgi:choline dehydrogenase-like flavoprotein